MIKFSFEKYHSDYINIIPVSTGHYRVAETIQEAVAVIRRGNGGDLDQGNPSGDEEKWAYLRIT